MAAKPRFDGEWVRLGELISKAKSKRCGSEIYPVLSMTMHDGIVEQADRFKKKIASRDTSSYKVVEPGQLVVGFPIDEGVIYVQNYPYPGIMSPAYNVWDINGDLIDPAYLELVLHGPKSMAYYADKMRGTTARRRSLTADNLCAMRVPLPSLERQRRVVHLFNTVKDEMAIAGRVVEALDQLVKSRFAEMFGDADHYEMLDQLIMDGTSISYGIVQPGSDVEGGIGVLRPVDFQAGRVEHGNIKTIDPEISGKYSRTVLTGNELLVVVRGATGDVALSDASLKGMNVTRGIAVVRYDRNKIIPEFLVGYLKSDEAQRYIAEHTQGSALKQINMADLRVQPIKVPSLDLQQEFAAFVARVEKSRFIVQQQIEKLQMLYDSLAQEYFS